MIFRRRGKGTQVVLIHTYAGRKRQKRAKWPLHILNGEKTISNDVQRKGRRKEKKGLLVGRRRTGLVTERRSPFLEGNTLRREGKYDEVRRDRSRRQGQFQRGSLYFPFTAGKKKENHPAKVNGGVSFFFREKRRLGLWKGPAKTEKRGEYNTGEGKRRKEKSASTGEGR